MEGGSLKVDIGTKSKYQREAIRDIQDRKATGEKGEGVKGYVSIH